MKTPIILSFAILGIASYGFAFDAGSGEAATPINSVPYTIASPGIYSLARDIFSSANAKITITASNVVLDLGGHTLSTSATDACITALPINSQSFVNLKIQNGAITNNVAECLYIVGANASIIDRVTMITKAQCALLDIQGFNNRISHCIFVSGNPQAQAGPNIHYGPALGTVTAVACSDLFENDIVTGQGSVVFQSFLTGGIEALGIGGTVLRDNIIRSPSGSSSAVLIDSSDLSINNIFPSAIP